jgi:hypothetical protein
MFYQGLSNLGSIDILVTNMHLSYFFIKGFLIFFKKIMCDNLVTKRLAT